VHLLNQDLSEAIIAIVFCITMTAFAILFGARHLSTRDKHQGLVVALGLESIIKLVAFVALALYCVISVFGGFAGMDAWFTAHHTELSRAQTQLNQGGSRSLLLVFFAATVAMPHLYHILLTENDDAASLRSARWGFPLYMLLVSLCIPPIVWAASLLNVGTPPEFFAVGIGLTLENRTVAMLAFIASVAAASGVLIVSTLALSSMTLNHLILPVYRPGWGGDIYAKLLTARRLLIAGIILAAYGIYRLIANDQALISLGIVAFVAVLQFLPGLVGTFYWRRANKSGLLAGLLAGFGLWFLVLFYPLIDPLAYSGSLTYPIAALEGASLPPLDHLIWHLAILGSLAVNGLLFVFFSWLYDPSVDEAQAADKCMSNSFARPFQGILQARSVAEIETSLALVLGETASRHEVSLALTELRLSKDEQRPHALSQIRKKMEINLSSSLGQTIAHRIIGRFVPFESPTRLPTFESVLSIETRMEDFRSQMTGLAAELDGLRRYHRQILQDLPTAVCSIGLDQSVLIWNRAMERLTAVSAEDAIGSSLQSLKGKWFVLLNEFAAGGTTHQLKTELVVDDQLFLLNLHKASIDSVPAAQGDVVIVIEDITEEQILEEQLLHNERLASIGQLAAGVAHEVGNPITGIACLAQNLLMETSDPELQDLGHQILDQTNRVSLILQSLVNFAHSGKSDLHRPRAPVDIRQCIHEALSLLSLNHTSHGIDFTLNFPLETYVLGDAQRLSQVFVNILTNARDASKSGDTVTISGYQQDSTVNITIVDHGHGVSTGNLNRMFEPFFTTKDPGQGTGLGLAITTTIIEEHHGAIAASSAGDGLGTRIKITLPLYLSSEIQLT
jgi:signal transduction histidine kinase/Na+/proline symporter